MSALVEELGVDTFPTPDEGETVVIGGGGRLVALEQALAQARLDRAARRVDLEAPWRTRGAERLDRRTLADWVARSALSARSRGVVERVLTGLHAADPREVSLLHTLFYVKSGDGTRVLFGREGGAQQDRFARGASELAERLARGIDVRLRSPVRRVEHAPDAVRVDGVEAKAAVLAVPPLVANRIEFVPALSRQRAELGRRMRHGDVTKIAVLYERAFWRERGLSGESYGPELPISFSIDLTPPGSDRGVLGVYVIGPRARRLRERDDRRDVVLGCLERAFGLAARHPVDYVERDWSVDEWSGGCWGGFMPPGAWTTLGPALRDPVGRISWASAETAAVWNGYLDGAVESGERAAAETLARLG